MRYVRVLVLLLLKHQQANLPSLEIATIVIVPDQMI